MKNKKIPVLSVCFGLIVCLFAALGCSSTSSLPEANEQQVTIIDRHDIALGEDKEDVYVTNAVVESFIREYNSKQTDPRLRVADGYKIEYDSFSKAYHVISDTVNLTVREKDGKFLFAGVSADAGLPVEDEIDISMTILGIVSSHNGGIPDDMLAYMNDVKKRASEIGSEYSDAYQRIDGALKDLNREEYLHGAEEEYTPIITVPEGVSMPTLPPMDGFQDVDDSQLPEIPGSNNP